MAEVVSELLEERARELGERAAMYVKRGGEWRSHSWNEYRDLTFRTARGLMALGLDPGRGVAIMGYNRPEWFFADLGAIAAGARPTGIYTNLVDEQIVYICDHCEAQVAMVENRDYLEKLLAVRGQLPGLEALVLWDGEPTAEERSAGVRTWDELMAAAGEVDEAALRQRIAAQSPDDVCTLIYTSGTTGPPKGVMLSHRNLIWTAAQVSEGFDVGAEHTVISYLPLSHSAEQMVSLYIPLTTGLTTWFAESLEKLPENLREVRPHVFFAVPRVWEKIQAAIQEAGAKNPPLKKKIAAWARRQGLAGGYAEQRGEVRPLLYPLAERLVFSKVKQRIGLDRALICSTGAAPIARDTSEFFLSLGIPIYEFYGLSETSAPATMSLPGTGRYRTGRAGVPLPGTEIVRAGDGELLIRGPHVFKGYYKSPAATAEVLDDEGFLHTGDVGEIDDEGFLVITDRKKELIITSGGKNIAPQILENKLKQIPAVEHAVVIGDRRNYLTALFTLEPGAAAAAAEEAGSPHRDPAGLASCPRFRAWLADRVEAVNRTLARYETIKKFHVLPEPFSVEGGELTPTLKLKRRVIDEKYGGEIEGLYEA
jgi:long-subunit acyl-CoA synthetase (AMP-forming)